MITNWLERVGIELPINFMLLVVIVIAGLIAFLFILTVVVSRIRRR